ncbi:cytochrome d ubiquinol oxidase subunit II [Paenibacillus sp. UMB4589-SE434]|uniref:cytochrome d ubiquinol oxidase subunit II n=1 Tax=Paenibacillus sp. UMB4589-SE434 TaxID=3046314 RepID=UPI00254AF53E|nr:cytochrome d ubiquinol oxidase subunit II [Paenibacillus sp. UMB4589-SE434]MDK8181418.1 cytochrome d ubiquinol oxidase subunit II [Paenibacillus sp. UMB4589-SE434]
MMELSELWFVLVGVLFVGFFFLEGFDFGVGMSTAFLAKTDGERRVLINSIGPFWDANEVWLITAGGAMFAAFPHWYATLFSGFYTPLVVVLLALIGRGVAFEFRGKGETETWKKTWDIVILFGSMLPPFLFGVVFANLLQGLPIDKNMEMNAGLFDVVNAYTVVGGVTVTVLCLVHGLLFATLRTIGTLQERARKQAKMLLVPLAVLFVAFAIMTYTMTDIFEARGTILTIMAVLGVIAFVLSGYYMSKKKDGWAFAMTGTVIALAISGVFVGMFPNVMISSIDSAFNLTVYNAASGAYSLKVMTIVALSLLPFVLGYQIWSYFVFHKRVHEKEHLEY